MSSSKVIAIFVCQILPFLVNTKMPNILGEFSRKYQFCLILMQNVVLVIILFDNMLVKCMKRLNIGEKIGCSKVYLGVRAN